MFPNLSIPKNTIIKCVDLKTNFLIHSFPPSFENAVSRIGQSVVPRFVDGAGEVEELALIVRTAAALAQHPDRVPDVVEHHAVGHRSVAPVFQASLFAFLHKTQQIEDFSYFEDQIQLINLKPTSKRSLKISSSKNYCCSFEDQI